MLDELREQLKKFSNEDFNDFIPMQMLGLSKEETLTVQAIFWFCHMVERDLDNVLRFAFRQVELIEGKTPDEVLKYISDTYQVEFHKVDPNDDSYDPRSVTFGQRISFVEKMQGKNKHIKFLWEVKNLRDDLSHLRIQDLNYKGKSLLDNEVKIELFQDYYLTTRNIEGQESKGGIVNGFSDEQKELINKKFAKWMDENYV